VKIIAITGGTGFIGRRLVHRHLSSGDQVRVLSRRSRESAALPPPVIVHHGDLTEGTDRLRAFVEGADILYHCAAELRDEARMREVHVEGTRRLMHAAAGRCGRVVFLSSVGVYGRAPGGIVTEQSPEHPDGMYEVTKVEAEREVRELSERLRMPHSILRPSKVFAPEMPVQDLYQLISFVDRGLYFFIGRAGAVANYAHAENVVEALTRCGDHPLATGGVFHVSDHRNLEDFIGVIARELGRRQPWLRIPERLARTSAKLFGRLPRFPLTEARITGLVNRTIYSNERIERKLGYAHLVTMEEGLAGMVRAWRERRGR
jgi:nucleoside-diphosphate-sugar epimerase